MQFVHLTSLYRLKLLGITLSLVCVPLPLVQSANTEFLLMKTHRVLNRSSKCAMSKLNKFSTPVLRHLPRKTRYKI